MKVFKNSCAKGVSTAVRSSLLPLMLFLFALTNNLTTLVGQNLTKEQVVEYINEKLKISDPVYYSFKMGDNGETVIRWVNYGSYTEYRFNIREIEIEQELSSTGDNYISLRCIPGVNNCLQEAIREDISRIGDKVTFANYKTLNIKSIAGYDNVTSLKNAMKYLKILSDKDNIDKTSSKRDPFLY